MERGRGTLYIYSDKDDQSILDFGEEENLAGIFWLLLWRIIESFFKPRNFGMRIFFFQGRGGINFWSKDIYIYIYIFFFFFLGGGVFFRSPNDFFWGGLIFVLTWQSLYHPTLPISLGAELILKISHLTRNTVRTLKKP